MRFSCVRHYCMNGGWHSRTAVYDQTLYVGAAPFGAQGCGPDLLFAPAASLLASTLRPYLHFVGYVYGSYDRPGICGSCAKRSATLRLNSARSAGIGDATLSANSTLSGTIAF